MLHPPRFIEKRVGSVSATAVEESAGGTQQATVERGIAHRDDLAGDEPVAPSLQTRRFR